MSQYNNVKTFLTNLNQILQLFSKINQSNNLDKELHILFILSILKHQQMVVHKVTFQTHRL